MSEASEQEILMLKAQLEVLSALQAQLTRNLDNIQLNASIRNDSVEAALVTCAEVRSVIASAHKSAAVTSFSAESISHAFDALLKIDDIMVKYHIAAQESFAVIRGNFSALQGITNSIGDDVLKMTSNMSVIERMTENPNLADEKVLRKIGTHPEKLRDKRAFSALDEVGED